MNPNRTHPMLKKSVRLVIGSCLAAFSVMGCGDKRPPIDIQRVLSWLPADTESILVANGPFWMSNFQIGGNENESHVVASEELEKHFEGLTLALFDSQNQLLEKHLARKKILFAVEGARHFRPPESLGETLYEGCAIAFFADDLGNLPDAFMNAAAAILLRTELIEGQKVGIFQEKYEQDIWTTFVTFPQKRVALVATNRDFLREVLARMRGTKGDRALPESLPEWKYVNKRAQFWGLRHFDRSQEKEDPTSPFGGRKSANIPDEKAIGLTYQCDSNKERKVMLTYLSGDKDGIKRIEQNRFPSFSEPESTAGLHIQYQELAPGVIQGTYDVSRSNPLNWFMFVFMGSLGHAIYV